MRTRRLQSCPAFADAPPAIRQGLPLADALETGFIGSRIPPQRRPQLVQQWFGNWAELGWICAPDLESLIKD